jgi:hypothetical protein
MNWRDEMALIEQKRDWRAGIRLLENINENNPALCLRAMFLLLDLLVDGQYTEEEHNFAADNLKEIFDKSNQRFSTNAEFLFFIGIMAYIGEWYFGMESVEPATTMLKKAMDIEPNNTLYEWGYYATINQLPEINTDLKLLLSEKLLCRETSELDWLSGKGLLGEYVIGRVEGTYKAVKAIKTLT